MYKKKQKKHLHTFGLLVSMVSFHAASFSIQVNGRLTLGENIADNGGIKESFTVSSFLNESILFARGNQATRVFKKGFTKTFKIATVPITSICYGDSFTKHGGFQSFLFHNYIK